MAIEPQPILDSVKLMLDVELDENAFDQVLIMHINTAFATLNQLNVGPAEGFAIRTGTELWTGFIEESSKLNGVISYVGLRVRLLFDPPTNSFGIAAIENQIKELEWRLMVATDPLPKPKTEEESFDVWRD